MATVISNDGTKIGYDKRGAGPAGIFVDGATGVRSAGYSNKLAELLSTDFTVYSYDRRGRGESTDTKPFSVQREIEDIEALIDAAGGSAFLYGISSGGALALEATIVLQGKIKKLAIYEVPYDSSETGVKAWREYRTKLKEALMGDRRGEANKFVIKFVCVPDERISGMHNVTLWSMVEGGGPKRQECGA